MAVGNVYQHTCSCGRLLWHCTLCHTCGSMWEILFTIPCGVGSLSHTSGSLVVGDVATPVVLWLSVRALCRACGSMFVGDTVCHAYWWRHPLAHLWFSGCVLRKMSFTHVVLCGRYPPTHLWFYGCVRWSAHTWLSVCLRLPFTHLWFAC